MLETRKTSLQDAALIAVHRAAMFEAMGVNQPALVAIRTATEGWAARMIDERKYIGWITCDESRPVASAGLLILDWPPTPHDPTGLFRGYMLNVFVEPEYRRRGLARALVEECRSEARHRGIRVVSLHASNTARPLYEQLGFRSTNEMYFIEKDCVDHPLFES
jgi:ribosomal protein S18 acetylase RimI-like enzyme